MAGLITPSSAQAAAAGSEAWSDCPSQHVCFYTGDNGTGDMCAWSQDDDDWWSGAIVCSWASRTRVQSVRNRGTSGAPVSYYTGAKLSGRVGCIASGTQGNLVGNGGAGYYLRSHTWKC
ncbi:peptidase inhibitor family I36 protein [Streptomyces kebangsaanensis]|uniref:Peptidase inhibitor family I36 protein n=1 Tax=Streptomyces kebangsaanensis TaxID=864058 RepID=A0ABW6L5J6_9ACTN